MATFYIHKNNRQLGPFEESRILEMLKSGDLSPEDFGIRQGEKDWQKLKVYFPQNGNAAPVANAVGTPNAVPVAVAANVAAPTVPKKSRKGLLLGLGGGFLIVLLIASVLGFLAIRNLYPSPSAEDLPETVKTTKGVEFALKNRSRGEGDIWGTEKTFAGIYANKNSPTDAKENIIALLSVYADEKAAREALENNLKKSCQSGEKPINFSFVDGNMKEVATGATCAAPLYVHKGSKIYSIGGPGVKVDNWIAFAENLPINQGSRMMSKPDVPVSPPQTFPDSNPEKKADFQVNASDFYKEALEAETYQAGIAKYKDKIVEISGLVYSDQSSDRKKIDLRTATSFLELQLGASQADKVKDLKETERIKAKCDTSASYRIELIDCVILERKPAVTLEETPDVTVTAKDFYEQIESFAASSEAREQNKQKYVGKVIDVTGEVDGTTDEKNKFRIADSKWLYCRNDEKLLKQFNFLKDKQQATFRATYDGNYLRKCILVRWF